VSSEQEEMQPRMSADNFGVRRLDAAFWLALRVVKETSRLLRRFLVSLAVS